MCPESDRAGFGGVLAVSVLQKDLGVGTCCISFTERDSVLSWS